MAKDRLLFLLSFALLGFIGAVLFRQSDVKPVDIAETQNADSSGNQKVTVSNNGDQKSLVLAGSKQPKNEEVLPANGNLAVPYQLTNRSAIVQFLNTGDYMDITFTSKDDIGFGRVSLTLLKDIRILDIGRDPEGNKTNYYRANTPTEILLEMSPRQAEIFSYAQLAGEVSLGITDKAKNEQNSELIDKLLQSESEGSFNSVLVTHMVNSLFPRSDIKVTTTTKGYIVSGKVSDPETSKKIGKVLELMSSGSEKSVVNLLEDQPQGVEVLVSQQELNPNDPITKKDYIWQHIDMAQLNPSLVTRTPQSEKWLNESIITNYVAKGQRILRSDIKWPEDTNAIKHEPEGPIVQEGKSIVPFQITTRSPIAQFLDPGVLVGVRFTSSADIGFGTVAFNLINSLRVISVGKDAEGKAFNRNSCYYKACSPLEVYLEMTPREAELLTFAQTAGNLSLELASNELPSHDNKLVEKLHKSESSGEFQSVMVTHMIRDLFPNVDIKITAAPKGYILEGKVPDPQIASKIIEVVARLVPGGEKAMVNMLEVEPQQVLLCIKVLEVVKEIQSKIGLNWEMLFQHNGDAVAIGATYPIPLISDPNFFLASELSMGNVNLSLLIDLLEKEGLGRVLAEPNLTTISDQTAHFFAGGEFPILIPQGGSGLIGTVTVEYKKYGVIVDFTPHVDLNGLVTIHVVPEVSNLDKQNAVVLQGFVIPALLTRRADTIVKLWPGQSYLIAGLLGDEFARVDDNLYWFSKLPIIGPLFHSRRFIDHQTDLMIVVTPYLINSDCKECYTPLDCGCEPCECQTCECNPCLSETVPCQCY